MQSLQTYQQEFIQLAIEQQVLTFGDFTLKSGRQSPYFFNSGLFYQSYALQKLGEFYAKAILYSQQLNFRCGASEAGEGVYTEYMSEADTARNKTENSRAQSTQAQANTTLNFDVLYGPAYKGIPLATTTGIALSQMGYNYPVTFNRKEIKHHGEGGNLIGAPLKGRRVLILDDVITAGTAFHESKKLIESQDAAVSGVIIALDRQEKGINPETKQPTTLSALQEIQKKEAIPVISIITLDNLITYLKEFSSSQVVSKMLAYREEYGV